MIVFMDYLFLIIVVVCVSGQNIFIKLFNGKSKDTTNASLMYLFCMASAALLLIAGVSGFQLAWHLPTFGYAMLFGLCFVGAIMGNVLAIKHGSLSLSALIVSYSLVIPTLFGFVFLDEELSLFLLVGLLLLLISLSFINRRKHEEGSRISLKWCFYIILAFGGNAMVSCVQKYHQVLYPGYYRNEFMAYAMMFVAFLGGILLLVTHKKGEKVFWKNGFLYALPAGIMNAVVNLLMMVLAVRLPASLLYPVVSAGGIVMTAVVSLGIYRERLSKQEFVGLALGILSVVFLNLS